MHDIQVCTNYPNIKGYIQLYQNLVWKLNRHIKTLKLNQLLQIKKLDWTVRFPFKPRIEVSYNGFTLFIEGLGYLAFKKDGEPYIPCGGKKALQSIIDNGGFIHFDDVYFMKPIGDTTRFDVPEYEAENIAYYHLQLQDYTDIKIKNIHWLTTEAFNATVSYTWYLNGHKKEVDEVVNTFYLDQENQWRTF